MTMLWDAAKISNINQIQSKTFHSILNTPQYTFNGIMIYKYQ